MLKSSSSSCSLLPAYVWLTALLMTGSACNRAVDPEELYGSWKYVKVVTPSAPEEDLDAEALSAESASVTFTRSDSLIIWWGGKRLSKGTFRIEGNLIRYREDLEGGTTREFPFRVNSLSGTELVFQTMSQSGTIVTAVKKK